MTLTQASKVIQGQNWVKQPVDKITNLTHQLSQQ